MCSTKSIDDLFEGRSENLILAFDKVLVGVIDWEPCTVGASTNAVVFTKEKAWLIIRPMTKEIDIKFYYPTKIDNPLIKKTSLFGKKIGHHIRISDEIEVTDELLKLLRMGYDAY